MKRNFTFVKLFAAVGILATTAMVLSFAYAQNGDDDKDKNKKRKIEKRIEIVEENGQKKVTVTTIENGNKKVETYTGEEAENYMREQNGTGPGNFHMSFDFDIDTTLGRNSFDFSMNGFGEEFEKEMEKMLEELRSSQSQMQFDFDEMFKSLDTMFKGKGYVYSYDFDNDMKDLDSLLKDMDIQVYVDKIIDENTPGNDKQHAGKQKRIVVIAHSVVIEDMGKKDAEKDLHVSEISFYPNPNGGNFTLRYKSESLDMIDIAVSDLNGKNVYNERVSATGTILRNIELNQPSGTYILTLTQGKKKVSKKLIIE